MPPTPTPLESIADPLLRFEELYRILDKDHLHLLPQCYGAEVVFEDPFHRVEGLEALRAYCGRLYANVISCGFTFHERIVGADSSVVTWTMHLHHPRLNGGRPFDTPGCSHLRFRQGLVVLHRDYFDAGAMIYERVSAIGPVIRFIKSRL